MKTTLALTLTVLIAVLPGAGAFAQPGGAPRVAVSYADLDLAKPGDRQVLQRRIAAAVDRVCPARAAPTELARARIYTMCRDQTLAETSQQLAVVYAQHELSPAKLQVASDQR
jgi:UrcA family protein